MNEDSMEYLDDNYLNESALLAQIEDALERGEELKPYIPSTEMEEPF